MSKTSSKPAKKIVEKSRAKDFAKLFSVAVKAGETSFGASDADNAARVGFASHDRTDGEHATSAKRALFDKTVAMLKAGQAVTADKLIALAKAKKLTSVQTGEPIKPSTIRAWLANWKRGIAGGAFYPCDPARKTEIEKLFAKMKKS